MGVESVSVAEALSHADTLEVSCYSHTRVPNQKFMFVATLRIVVSRWLWPIMLGNANETRKSRVGYSRLPTEFHILETQL